MVFPSGWSWQADKTKHDTQDSWSYMQLDQLSPTVGNNSVVTSPFLALTVRYHSAQRTDLWDGAHGAAGCPSSPADLLGWLCWDFSVDLPFWSTFGTYKQEILGEVLFLLLVVFAPYMLVRLHRKIKQLCKLDLICGTRTHVLPYHTPYDHRAALSGLCFAGAEHAELPFTDHILWPYLICFSVFHCPAINHEFLASQSFNQYIKYQIR